MSKEKTDEPRNLEAVTTDLGNAYKRWKTGEKDKESLRLEFFSMAKEAISSETLAQKTISVADFESEPEAEEWIAKQYPTWRLIGIEIREDDVVALLEEDPEWQEYTFINPADNQVYKRQIVSGGTLLDEEKLKKEDPDLWERITEEVIPEPVVRLRASEELEAEDLAKMQKFMYPGKPQVKLPAPRKAKDEDFQDGND